MRPREPYRRDDDYLLYVRRLPCLLAGRMGAACNGATDPAHVRSKGAGGKDYGNVVPLCHRHHTEQHQIGIMTFQRRYFLDLPKLARELADAYVAFDLPF